MSNENHHDEGKQILGACTGGAAGLIGGGKLGIGVAAATAAIPVVGPFLAGAILIGAPVAGAILGAKAGRRNPTGGVMSFFMSIFIPSGLGDGGVTDSVTDAVTTTTTLS